MKRFEKAPKSSERLSYIYRTEFVDGKVHFGRVNASKNYSEKNYLSNLLSSVKHNSNNPLRTTMITEFERKLYNEFPMGGVKCEIVFAGPTDEAKKFRDSEVSKLGAICMNTRSSGSDMLGIDNIVRVAKEFTKAIRSANNEMIYFIDPTYGRKMGLVDKMISNIKYPLDNKYIKLACVQVERF